MPVVIRNTQAAVRLDVPYLRRHANRALAAIQAGHYQLDWWFCGLSTIRALNSQFRGKDKTTDVLSFPVVDGLQPGQLPPPVFGLDDLPLSLGSVVMAPRFLVADYPPASSDARLLPLRRGRPPLDAALPLRADPFHQRMLVLFVHSLCHLVGYTHDASDDWAAMQRQERFIWKCLRKEEDRKSAV